jgi:response regulator of citrate/malate metabolism
LKSDESVRRGWIRVGKLEKEYQKKGYFVLVNANFNAGVDLIIVNPSTGQIHKVIESTNYSRKNYYIKDEKFNRYVKQLNKFDRLPNVEKEFVVSYKTNLNQEQIDILTHNNIKRRVEGHPDTRF